VSGVGNILCGPSPRGASGTAGMCADGAGTAGAAVSVVEDAGAGADAVSGVGSMLFGPSPRGASGTAGMD